MFTNLVNLQKNSKSQKKLCVSGLKEVKLKSLKQTEVIEDISIMKKLTTKKSTLISSTPEFLQKKHEDDLKRQVKFLQELYPKYKVITDIGSGINFNRKGFNNIIKAVIAGTVKEIVVAHKDRLCRFGFELIENLCKHFSTTITVINDNDDKSTESELAEDLLSIITIFTARFYGKRKYNKNKNKNETKNDKKYRKERNTVYNNKNKNIPKSTATNII
jgi:hypothetical protein